MTPDERPVSPAAKLLSILLALLAPARMAWIVFTYGENNLSNDYIARVPLVVSMLDGTCTVETFIRNAWIRGSHSTLAVTPIYWLNARFFEWSVSFEIALGLALVGATLALLAAALPHSVRWRLLPLFSVLLFSTSRVTVFTFGEPTLQYGLSQLGVALGAFAFARWDRRPILLAGALSFGGVLASWSWGGGIVVWPVIFAALVARRERRFSAWAIVAAGAAAGLFQYVWFLPKELGATAAHVPWTTRAAIFLDVLGRPFVNGIAHADPNDGSRALGAAGLIALAGLAVVLREKLGGQPVALFLIAWALLVAAQIALVRSAVAAWYASPMALFWIGMVLLFAASPPPLRTGGVLVVALLSLRVQGTWEDKSFYLPSRAPVSAACLREWRAAPPACHSRVFQWGDEGRLGELARLGEPLERRGLSVFGPRRTYLLQGDAALGRVRPEPPDARSFFSADGRTPGDGDDFRRLDLVLPPGAAVTWRVDLPPNLESARFETRVRSGAADGTPAWGARVSIAGEDSDVRAPASSSGPTPLALDLRAHAGRAITLRLAAEEATAGAPVVLEAPRVLLVLNAGGAAQRP